MSNTSKNYYESVMRDYRMYARGRSLEQYCKDEAIDFQWLTKAQQSYTEPEEKGKKKITRKTRQSDTDLIQLHYDAEDDESEDATPVSVTVSGAKQETDAGSSHRTLWSVANVTITSPSGNEIEIKTSNLSAVSELLAKLAV